MRRPEMPTVESMERAATAGDVKAEERVQEKVDSAVRFSHLRAYGKTGMNGHHARLHDSEQTTAMQRGSAVHAIVFGTRRVVAYPGATRRGKEYDAFAAANLDAEILTAAEYAKAQRMADAVRESKLAAPMLEGIAEETILFRWMGLNCRSTPDVRGKTHLTELKTSASADPMRFPWHALRMAYHAQMAMQQIACAKGNHRPDFDCYIVCVEATEPHPVSVFRIDEKALEAGEKLLVLWAERLKQCEASNVYPAYSDAIVPIILPETDDAGLIFPNEETPDAN